MNKNNFRLFSDKEKNIKNHFSLNGLELNWVDNDDDTIVINDRINEPLEDEEEFLQNSSVKPFKYQIEAVRWMRSIEREYNDDLKDLNRKKEKLPVGGILADVMGLGKTIDSLLLVLHDVLRYKKSQGLKSDLSFDDIPCFKRSEFKPTLIIASLSLVYNWYDEAVSKFNISPEFILKYHGDNRKKKLMQMLSEGKTPLVVLTTYTTLQREYKDVFEEKSTKKKTSPESNSMSDDEEDENLDNEDDVDEEKQSSESQNKKSSSICDIPINKYSPLYQNVEFKRTFYDEAHTARNKKRKTRYALKNIVTEARFGLTGTPIFNSPDDIINLSHVCTEREPLEKYSNSQSIETWKKKYLLRRNKDVIDLPSINQEDAWLDLYPEEKEQYEKLEKIGQKIYEAVVKSNSKNQYKKILKILIRLRQECTHPYLKLGRNHTSKLLNHIKKVNNQNEEVENVIVPKPNIKKDIIYSQKEIDKLINMDPNVEEDGSVNFLVSDEDMTKRKQLINKIKKTRHKEKKINIQKQLINILHGEKANDQNQIQDLTVQKTKDMSETRDTFLKNFEKKEKKGKIEKFLSSVSFQQFDENNDTEKKPNSKKRKSSSPKKNSNDNAVDIIKFSNEDEIEPTNFIPNKKLKTTSLDNSDKIDPENAICIIEDIDELDKLEYNGVPSLNLGNNETKEEFQDIDEFDGYITNEIERLTKDLNYDLPIPRSTKIDYLKDQLDKIRKRNPYEKSLVISQWTTMLDIIECILLREGYKISRLDGRQQDPLIRQQTIKNFCSDPDITIFLTSLKAGGEGINLTAAENAFIIDPWWNRALECQAGDRIHRIGQKNDVKIIRILIRNSIEENVLEIQDRKKEKEKDFYLNKTFVPMKVLKFCFSRAMLKNN